MSDALWKKFQKKAICGILSALMIFTMAWLMPNPIKAKADIDTASQILQPIKWSDVASTMAEYVRRSVDDKGANDDVEAGLLKVIPTAPGTMGNLGALFGYNENNGDDVAKGRTVYSVDNYSNIGNNGAGVGNRGYVFTKYAYFGSCLAQLNLDDVSTEADTGRGALHVAAGSILGLFYTCSKFINVLFQLILNLLQLLNPFAFFYKAFENSGNTAVATLTQTGGISDNAANSTLGEHLSDLYKAIYAFSTSALIPIMFFVLLIGFIIYHRDPGKRVSMFRNYVVRLAFIVLAVPLLGVTYTGVLDQLDAEVDDESPASDMVLSTLVDFRSWAQKTRLSVYPDLMKIEVDDDGRPTYEAVGHVRSTAKHINEMVGYGSAGDLQAATGSYDTKDSLEDATASSNNNILDVASLIKAYTNNDLYTTSDFTSVNIKSAASKSNDKGGVGPVIYGRMFYSMVNLANYATEDITTSKGGTATEWPTGQTDTDALLTSLPDDSTILKFSVSPESDTKYKKIVHITSGLFDPSYNLFYLGAASGPRQFNIFNNGSMAAGGDEDTCFGTNGAILPGNVLTFSSQNGSTAGTASAMRNITSELKARNLYPNERGGLSTMTMRNYLSTSFDGVAKSSEDATNSVVQVGTPSESATSSFVVRHYAVNLVGYGSGMQFAYWLQCCSYMVCITVMGFLFAFGLLAGTLRNVISIIVHIPFGLLGFLQSIVHVVSGGLIIIVDAIMNIFLYSVSCDLLAWVNDIGSKIVEKIAADQSSYNTYFSDDGTAKMSSVLNTINFPMALDPSGFSSTVFIIVLSIVSVGIGTILNFFIVIFLFRQRGKLVKAAEDMIDGVAQKIILGDSNAMGGRAFAPQGSGLKERVGGAAMTAGGFMLSNALSGSDDAEQASATAPGAADGSDTDTRTSGNIANGSAIEKQDASPGKGSGDDAEKKKKAAAAIATGAAAVATGGASLAATGAAAGAGAGAGAGAAAAGKAGATAAGKAAGQAAGKEAAKNAAKNASTDAAKKSAMKDMKSKPMSATDAAKKAGIDPKSKLGRVASQHDQDKKHAATADKNSKFMNNMAKAVKNGSMDKDKTTSALEKRAERLKKSGDQVGARALADAAKNVKNAGSASEAADALKKGAKEEGQRSHKLEERAANLAGVLNENGIQLNGPDAMGVTAEKASGEAPAASAAPAPAADNAAAANVSSGFEGASVSSESAESSSSSDSGRMQMSGGGSAVSSEPDGTTGNPIMSAETSEMVANNLDTARQMISGNAPAAAPAASGSTASAPADDSFSPQTPVQAAAALGNSIKDEKEMNKAVPESVVPAQHEVKVHKPTVPVNNGGKSGISKQAVVQPKQGGKKHLVSMSANKQAAIQRDYEKRLNASYGNMPQQKPKQTASVTRQMGQQAKTIQRGQRAAQPGQQSVGPRQQQPRQAQPSQAAQPSAKQQRLQKAGKTIGKSVAQTMIQMGTYNMMSGGRKNRR